MQVVFLVLHWHQHMSALTCSRQGRRKACKPSLPAYAPISQMWWKKAALSCQSRSFRKVIIAGSRKSLLSLHTVPELECAVMTRRTQSQCVSMHFHDMENCAVTMQRKAFAIQAANRNSFPEGHTCSGLFSNTGEGKREDIVLKYLGHRGLQSIGGFAPFNICIWHCVLGSCQTLF